MFAGQVSACGAVRGLLLRRSRPRRALGQAAVAAAVVPPPVPVSTPALDVPPRLLASVASCADRGVPAPTPPPPHAAARQRTTATATILALWRGHRTSAAPSTGGGALAAAAGFPRAAASSSSSAAADSSAAASEEGGGPVPEGGPGAGDGVGRGLVWHPVLWLLAPSTIVAGLSWSVWSDRKRREEMRADALREITEACGADVPQGALDALGAATEKEIETNHVLWAAEWMPENSGGPHWRLEVHARKRFFWRPWVTTQLRAFRAEGSLTPSAVGMPPPQMRRWTASGAPPEQWRVVWQRGTDKVGVAPSP